jgi:hypothetical protein
MKAIKITLVLIAMVSTLFLSGAAADAAIADRGGTPSMPAAADLSRVEWKTDHSGNPGFENWDGGRPEDLYTYVTTEQYTWYATSPWPVSEGSRSYGMQARAWTSYSYPEARLTRSSWSYWDNPANLTLKMDWYVDSLATPVDGDVFEINVELGAPGDRELHYYFGCESTTVTNSSWRAYFMMPGSTGVWNTFDRNITEDFFEAFGSYPVEFQLFNIYLRSTSYEYSRVFVDDIWMVNGSVIIGGSTQNGNFETGSFWYSATDYDPSIVSQSTVREEGDYSLNVTTISNGNQSMSRVESHPEKWVSTSNPDTFQFSWRVDEYAAMNDDTYAWVYVSCSNDTEEFYIYYMLYSGPGFVFPHSNSIVINATGYNTTGQWNHFSRSILADVNAVNQTGLLQIDDIGFYTYARTTGARTVLLIDDLSLISAAISDMSYEDQGNPGNMIYAWEDYSPTFNVTDVANTGQKAANLTLVDGDYFYSEQITGYVSADQYNDLWVDLFWQIADNTGGEGNQVFFSFYLYDEVGDEHYSLAYFLLNSSPIEAENGFDAYIVLTDANSEGAWYNMQRNLYNDCVTAFGASFSARLDEVAIEAEVASGGRLEVLFDDIYLYTDPEPEITHVTHSPLEPFAGESVDINASVYDPSLESVVLYYRVDNGSWLDIDMSPVGDAYSATTPSQSPGATVEYYVEAADSFGNVAQSSTSSYTVAQAPPATPIVPPLVGLGVVVVVAIVIALLLYLFYFKPRQSAE